MEKTPTPAVRLISDFTIRNHNDQHAGEFVASAALSGDGSRLTVTTPVTAAVQIVPPNCRKPRVCYLDAYAEVDLQVTSDDGLVVVAQWDERKPYGNDLPVTGSLLMDSSSGQFFYDKNIYHVSALDQLLHGEPHPFVWERYAEWVGSSEQQTLGGNFFARLHLPAFLDNGAENPLLEHVGFFPNRNRDLCLHFPHEVLRRCSNDYRALKAYKADEAGVPMLADLAALQTAATALLNDVANAVRLHDGRLVTACHPPQFDVSKEQYNTFRELEVNPRPLRDNYGTYQDNAPQLGISLADRPMRLAVEKACNKYSNFRIFHPDFLPGQTLGQALAKAEAEYAEVQD